jgi:hypothetical protein
MADEDVIAVLSGRGDQTKQKSVTEGRLIAGVACGQTCGINVGSGAIQRPAEGAARQKVVETAVAWGGPRRRKGREQQKRKAEQRCCGHVVFSQMKSSKAYVQICSAARCVKNERARAAALGAPGWRQRQLGIDFNFDFGPHESARPFGRAFQFTSMS